nr:PREDICTED: uncharacterized protein LOC103554368 [Equus przewalskii]XP_008523624.1 PREDICTED: uncharacterized protein LOC103554368 [Equus przewalskii]
MYQTMVCLAKNYLRPRFPWPVATETLQTVSGHPGRAHSTSCGGRRRPSISKSVVFSHPPLSPCLAPSCFTHLCVLPSEVPGADTQPGTRGCLNTELPRGVVGRGRPTWQSVRGSLGWEVRLRLGLKNGEDPLLLPGVLPPPPTSLPLLPLNSFLEEGKLHQDSMPPHSSLFFTRGTSSRLPGANADVTASESLLYSLRELIIPSLVLAQPAAPLPCSVICSSGMLQTTHNSTTHTHRHTHTHPNTPTFFTLHSIVDSKALTKEIDTLDFHRHWQGHSKETKVYANPLPTETHILIPLLTATVTGRANIDIHGGSTVLIMSHALSLILG